MSPQVNQLMQQYLPWHKARVTFTAAFILSLLTKLHQAFQCAEWTAKPASNYRRIQRFFAHFDLSGDCLTRLICTCYRIHHEMNRKMQGMFADEKYKSASTDETGAYLDLKSALWSDRDLLGENGLRGYKHKTFSLPSASRKTPSSHQGVKRYPCESFLQTCTSISKPSCANPAAFMSSLCICLRYD